MPLSTASLRELMKIKGAFNPEATTLVEQIQANRQGTESSSHAEMMNCVFLIMEEGVSVNTMYDILLLVSQVEAIEYRKDDGLYDKPTKYEVLQLDKEMVIQDGRTLALTWVKPSVTDFTQV